MSLHARPLFGIGLNQPVGRSEELLGRLEAAEAGGYDLFSLWDHPYSARWQEAYATLGFALGRTRRIAGYVSVTNLPLRPPAVLARTLSSLSDLSGGRVAFGIGSGGYWEHITRLGVPQRTPREAVGAFAEAIQLVRALTGGPGKRVDFDGGFYQVAGISPAAVPTPPIWTGAGGPRALAITGRSADGWIPPNGADWRSDRVRDGRAVIDQAAADAGRQPTDVITVYNVGGALTDDDLAVTRDADGRWLGGSARQWIDELTAAVLEYGAEGFTTDITDESGQSTRHSAERFAAEVIPAIRDAVG